MTEKDFVPYIPPDQSLPELTFKVFLIGGILAIVMGSANAYLGLYVGMTVSASIPAAVISMIILRFLKGNILENNMIKTMAAAGEALAAGVIFTIPALIIAGVWTEIHYFETTVAALVGGTLGVLFTIPLRRILIVDLDLPYPEGVACTEVLKAGDKGGKGLNYVFAALGIGALFKFTGSSFGLHLWQERLMSVFGGGRGRIFGGLDVSPALLGVGYIIGPRIAGYILAGGIFGWIIMIPIMGGIVGWPQDPMDSIWTTPEALGGLGYPMDIGGIFHIWHTQTMFIGIGAIIVGGLWTLFTMRGAITKGIKGIAGQKGESETYKPIRTEQDFPFKSFYFIFIGIGMFLFYLYVLSDLSDSLGYKGGVAFALTIIMLIAGFLFTAIAGYLAGIIGSSNNPISGVTVATLLFTALLLLGFGATSDVGITATILVAAIVCCSAAIAGDCMQELKTGQLLGSTPRNLQIAEFYGVFITGLIIAFVVGVLHAAYQIGTLNLPAPQALVMNAVVSGVFRGNLNWTMFGLGIVLAVTFIIVNTLGERGVLPNLKIPIMAVAIGIYLPITLTIPIMIGGIVKWRVNRFIDHRVDTDTTIQTHEQKTERISQCKEDAESTGILFSSGLIAGEALMGVMIAVLVGFQLNLTIFELPASWPGFLIFLYIAFLLGYMAVRPLVSEMSISEIKKLLFRK
jgi:putative OPT family oligopeptide transporter